MKLALIAHGMMPIPPKGWGAVEGTLWQRKLHLERLGHRVDIENTHLIHAVLARVNRGAYDFVHCHNEMFVPACTAHLARPFAFTSHHGGLHSFDPDVPDWERGTHYLFQDTLHAPANLVLSERIAALYRRCGYRGFMRVLRNAVEANEFRFTAHGNGKAICVGVIGARKRQGWLADVARHGVHVDFVGPWDRDAKSQFAEHETARYLGAWDRSTLYERLTDYSCLALLSASEAAPKVVLEALAAGLSVVVTEACAANLTDEDFISIVSDREDRPDVVAHAIQSAIDGNGPRRQAIRDYARERFDYAVVTPEYVRIIEEYLDQPRGQDEDATLTG